MTQSPLPAGWAWAPLGEIGSWTGGGTPSKANDAFWTGGTIPWVSAKDMKVDVIESTEDRITESAVQNSAAKYVPPGSVLMVMRSGILRHSFPVAVNAVRVTINQDLRAMTPASGIEPRFIARYLNFIEQQILHECSKDGTTVQSVEMSALARVPVPLAPPAEQRRIVVRIDELFAEIAEGEAALERARGDLDTWRRALLKAAVTGELTRDWRDSDSTADAGFGYASAEPMFDVPNGWMWTTIGELVSAIDYGTSDKCGTEPVGVAVLRMGNIQDGEVDASRLKYADPGNAKTLPLLETGDILFNRTNSAELVGKSAVYRGTPLPCSFASYLIRLRVPDADPDYVVMWLNSAFGKRWIADNKSQQVGQANLSGGKLKRMPIPLPPMAEQREIARRASEYLAAAGDMSLAAGTIDRDREALRQSILKSAFEGRIVSQNPADEPVAALLARLQDRSPLARPLGRRGRPRKEPVTA